MSVRILLTGKNGQVGFELRRALAPLGEVIAVGQAECNLADQDAIRSLVGEVRPDIIVHPAAYTAVDKAESEVDIAFAINGVAPGVLGEEAAKINALVVHYCTDYVFDGVKQAHYTEDDLPNPQSVYGKSKLAGELALRQRIKNHLVFRTSWVFGAHGNNFAKTVLRLAAERESLSVVADQFGAPTSAALIADVTAQIVGQYQRQGRQDFPFGLYNLVAGGETTWCDFAKTVIKAAHGVGRPLKLKPENIRPITTAEYPLPAPRPANSRLATHKLQETFGLRLPPWQEGLDHVLQQIF
jgi:dTDP-4-dehydrorhamnose reductase